MPSATSITHWRFFLLLLLGVSFDLAHVEAAQAHRRCHTCYVETNRCCAELQQCRQKVIQLEKHIV